MLGLSKTIDMDGSLPLANDTHKATHKADHRRGSLGGPLKRSKPTPRVGAALDISIIYKRQPRPEHEFVKLPQQSFKLLLRAKKISSSRRLETIFFGEFAIIPHEWGLQG